MAHPFNSHQIIAREPAIFTSSIAKQYCDSPGMHPQRPAKMLSQIIMAKAMRGSFLSRAMLLALVEELGHEYEHLMIGAVEDEQDQEAKPDPTGLVVLNGGLEAKLGIGQDDLDDDDESSGEEEDEREEEESEEEY